MPNFSGCAVIPSNLCRYAGLDASVYRIKSSSGLLSCDADQLPVCSVLLLELIAAARAIDQETSPGAYQIALAAANTEVMRRADLTEGARTQEDAILLAEAERLAGLTQDERDEEDRRDALTEDQRIEEIRRSLLTQEQRDKEDEALRREALTQEQRDEEDSKSALTQVKGVKADDGPLILAAVIVCVILLLCGICDLLIKRIAISGTIAYFLILHKRPVTREIQGLVGTAYLALLSEIDRGGFGTVWRGKYNGRDVAVQISKLMRKGQEDNSCGR
jgi:hypothetical protein